MKFMEKAKRFFTLSAKHEGFTLVELIVVIAILAILAGVAVPAYSGYIKKADKANDVQLLSAVNAAFAAAYLDATGHDMAELNGAGLTLAGDKSVESVSHYNDQFQTYYAGNTGKFKFLEQDDIAFVQGIGFLPKSDVPAGATYSVGYNGGYISLNRDSVNAVIGSNLAAAGVETLMTQAAAVVGFAATGGLVESSGPAFQSAWATYLGLPADATMEEIEAKTWELSGEDGEVASNITANAMAIYAAQNTKDMTIEDVSQWMGKSTADIQAAASGETLGQASAIYGMYMSFKGENFDGTQSVLDVMKDAMADGDFKDWMETDEAEKELDAFKGAMDIISTASGDQNATNGLLLNGFADEELIGIMQGIIGTK